MEWLSAPQPVAPARAR
jgi:hypothetical protein